MAKILFGNMVQDARGKLAGTIFSANKAGAYTRRKASPTGPATPAQAAVRAAFGSNSKLWSGAMSDDQRAAWKFFAQANPVVDVFGNSIVLSGMSMAQKLNQRLVQIDEDPILDPPSDMSVPAIAAATGAQHTLTGSDLDSIQIDTAAQAVVADAEYYIFSTGALPGGKSAQKNMYRFMLAAPPSAAATSVDFTTPYLATFGAAFPAGSYISVLVATINSASGAVTPGLIFTTKA
jgi:hypothetical protein